MNEKKIIKVQYFVRRTHFVDKIHISIRDCEHFLKHELKTHLNSEIRKNGRVNSIKKYLTPKSSLLWQIISYDIRVDNIIYIFDTMHYLLIIGIQGWIIYEYLIKVKW